MELNAEEYLLGGMGSGMRGATQGRHQRIFEPKKKQNKTKHQLNKINFVKDHCHFKV